MRFRVDEDQASSELATKNVMHKGFVNPRGSSTKDHAGKAELHNSMLAIRNLRVPLLTHQQDTHQESLEPRIWLQCPSSIKSNGLAISPLSLYQSDAS